MSLRKRILCLVVVALVAAGLAFAGAQREPAATAPAVGTGTPGTDVRVFTTPSEYQRETGRTIARFNEAPMLAELVQARQLPPLSDRLPDEPSVVEPWASVGQYGGTLRMHRTFLRDFMNRGLLQQDSQGTTVRNDLATGWEYSDDYTQVTLYLRKGVKWSDGEPFTVDDILFWWHEEMNNRELNPAGPSGAYAGAEFVRVDDYTLRINFASPQPAWIGQMSHPYSLSQAHFYQPAHYLGRYHIDHNPDANELAREEGYTNWVQAYQYHTGRWERQNRANAPTLDPWIVKEITTTYTIVERNPYFWQVDTEGNQLPYIDRVIAYEAADPQIGILQMISGEWDYMSGFQIMTLADYPMLKERERDGRFRVVNQIGDYMTDMTITLNPLAPDPVMRDLIRDRRLREALSIAIDRDAITETVFFGLTEPRQQAPLPTVSFYKDEWGTYATEFDPDRANRLLDEMGLQWNSARTFRLRPDGRVLEILSLSGHGSQLTVDIAEVITQHWEKIGVRLILRPEKATQDVFRNDQWEMMMTANGGGSTHLANIGATPAFSWWNAFGWQNWLNTNGRGEYVVEPPEEWKEVQRWTDEAATLVPESPRWTELKQKIWDRKVTSLYDIGTVYKSPSIELVGRRLVNMPEGILFGWSSGIHCLYQTQQWYLTE